jgi:hypothetical protein
MKAGCRISTRDGAGQSVLVPTGDPQVPQELGFPSDSKSLSGFLTAYISRLCPLMPLPSEIGRERASKEAQARFKVLQPKAARRKL